MRLVDTTMSGEYLNVRMHVNTLQDLKQIVSSCIRSNDKKREEDFMERLFILQTQLEHFQIGPPQVGAYKPQPMPAGVPRGER